MSHELQLKCESEIKLKHIKLIFIRQMTENELWTESLIS